MNCALAKIFYTLEKACASVWKMKNGKGTIAELVEYVPDKVQPPTANEQHKGLQEYIMVQHGSGDSRGMYFSQMMSLHSDFRKKGISDVKFFCKGPAVSIYDNTGPGNPQQITIYFLTTGYSDQGTVQ